MRHATKIALRGCSLAAVLALGVSGLAQAQFGAGPAELSLIEVQDDIYVINNDVVPGNITVLVTEEGALIVDTKYAIDYENVSAMLEDITDQPIRFVVNTHYHDDHSGANAMFQELDASVLAHENARSKMVSNGRDAGLPSFAVGDFSRIHIGGTVADIYYFGISHTDGDIVVHLPEKNILITGDMFAYGPATPELVDYGGGGSAIEWPRSLDRALELDFDTVVPGHGVVTTRDELVHFRNETQRLAELTHEMIEQDRSRDEIEAMLREEFSFGDLHINMSLDGLMNELR